MFLSDCCFYLLKDLLIRDSFQLVFSGLYFQKNIPFSQNNVKKTRIALILAIGQAIDRGFTTFITGMAQGTDIWAAEIVLEKRRTNPALKLICALPHPNFEKPWQADWQARFSEVLRTADLQRTIWPVYAKSSYQKRNIWMVDHSALLIAVFSGKAGGTLNTIHYAQQKHVEIMYADMQSEGFHDPV